MGQSPYRRARAPSPQRPRSRPTSRSFSGRKATGRARRGRSTCSASRGRSAAGSVLFVVSRCRNTSRTRVRGRPSLHRTRAVSCRALAAPASNYSRRAVSPWTAATPPRLRRSRLPAGDWPAGKLLLPRWAYSGRIGGHPQTRRARARAREALAFDEISARLSGALQTRRELIRDLRLPCGLLVSYTAKHGCRRGPRHLAAPTSPSTVPKSARAGEVDALERRSAAAQRRPTQLRSRAPRTGSPWHRGVDFCPSRHRRGAVLRREL